MSDYKLIALIPARAGSKRVQGKNTRRLEAHPLIAYTIAAARQSGIFSSVIVSTDSPETARIAHYYGAEVPFLRPAELAEDLSPDIGWVEDIFKKFEAVGRQYDAFALLRPTSPFRQPQTIQRAWAYFLELKGMDSIRAVEKCKQHPGKMWIVEGQSMTPLLKEGSSGDLKNPPWHSSPYQSLPVIHTQNASLEIAWTRALRETHTISGKNLAPFFTEGYEGFDINDPKDWWYAEYLLAQKEVHLPDVPQPPYTD
jgi:CMP-N,N'-diacetyllegionaminic acid synthase